jgi:hypothetical protein
MISIAVIEAFLLMWKPAQFRPGDCLGYQPRLVANRMELSKRTSGFEVLTRERPRRRTAMDVQKLRFR